LGFLLLLSACGGGGGGGPLPAIEQGVILGIVRADAPTPINVQIANPLAADATVEEVGGAGGPFAPTAGDLPASVAEGEELTLHVVFTPPAPGSHSGEIHLRFLAGKKEREVVLKLVASVETPALALLTPQLAFPSTLVGEERTLDVRVRNPNQLTPVNVTGVSTLPSDFATTFQPRTVFPGDTITFRVTFEPLSPGDHDFFLSIANGAGPTLDVRVTAGSDTWIAEQVTDFGTVPLTGGESGWLEVDVPPDGISLSIEAVAPNTGASPGLLGFEGPGGKIYENDTTTGVFLQVPGSDGVFAATLPNTDDPNIQLVPGGGTYRFRFFLFGGSASSLDVRAIVENRLGAVADEGAIDLNVYLAPGLSIASPETDTKLQAVLARTDDIFAQLGLRLGDVDYYQLSDSAYNSIGNSEFSQLVAESSVASAVRTNVFFVQSALGGGTLGVAAALPGPKLNGTPVSGVMVDYDFSDAAAVGQVTAHEIGHYLGLYHTTESDGSHDFIGDTLECPASGTNAACTTPGGGYVMHWQYIGQTLPVITDGQAHVLLAHPLVDPLPPLAGLSALAQKKAPALAWVELPPGFCGTCAKHK
jgi:hypothetical protein